MFTEIAGCKADIAFLVDKSGSIVDPNEGGKDANWVTLKNFIYQVMDAAGYGTTQADGVQFATLFFANQAKIQTCFNNCTNTACVRDSIENGPGRVKPPVSISSAICNFRLVPVSLYRD